MQTGRVHVVWQSSLASDTTSDGAGGVGGGGGDGEGGGEGGGGGEMDEESTAACASARPKHVSPSHSSCARALQRGARRSGRGPQISKPELVPEPSLVKVIVAPGASCTPSGLVVPL
jgi:hypothetical protein